MTTIHALTRGENEDAEYGHLMVVPPGTKPIFSATAIGLQQHFMPATVTSCESGVVEGDGMPEYSYPTFPVLSKEERDSDDSPTCKSSSNKMETSYIILTSAQNIIDSCPVDHDVKRSHCDHSKIQTQLSHSNVPTKPVRPLPLPRYRDHSEAPLRKLSEGLILTYKKVNQVYYQSERRRNRNAAPNQTDSRHPPTSGSSSGGNSKTQMPCSINPHQHYQHIEAPTATSCVPDNPNKEGQPPTAESLLRELGLSIGERLCGRYQVRNLLGRGSFGYVLSVTDLGHSPSSPSQQHVHFSSSGSGGTGNSSSGRTAGTLAVKVIQPKAAYIKQAEVEIRILETIRHLQNRIATEQDTSPHSVGAAHIVTFYGHFLLGRQLCLVFEQLSYNLYDLLLKTNLTGVSLNLTRKFGQQLCDALAFLARPELQLIHCDLKPENILLVNPKRSHIKVIDFGSSCYRHEKIYHYIQSRFYRAPEVILGHEYDMSIDMWSLGCILFEMHYGHPLFSGQNEADQMMRIVEYLGVPPMEMLVAGKKTRHFFEFSPNAHNPSVSGTYTPLMNRTRHTQNQQYTEPGGRCLWQPMMDVRNRRRAKFLSQQQPHQLQSSVHPVGMSPTHEPGHTDDDYARFVSLLTALLTYNPRDRPQPLQAARHPFLESSARKSPLSSLNNLPATSHTINHLPHSFQINQQQQVEQQFHFADQKQSTNMLSSLYVNHSVIHQASSTGGDCCDSGTSGGINPPGITTATTVSSSNIIHSGMAMDKDEFIVE